MTTRWLQHRKSNHYLISSDELNTYEAEECSTHLLTEDEQLFLQAAHQKARRHISIKRLQQVMGLAVILGAAFWANHTFHLGALQQQTEQQLNSLTQHITTQVNPQLQAKGELMLLKDINTSLLKIFEHNTPQTDRQLSTQAAALNVMGELSFNDRKSAAALSYFSQSEQLIKQANHANQPELMAHLMFRQYWLGYLGFVKSNYSQANLYWQSYLQTSLLLQHLEPTNTKWQL